MRSNWFSGPAFLWEKEIPTSKEEIPNIRIGGPEVKATVRTTVVKESFSLIGYVSRFSDWTRAVGVISYLRRPFKKNKLKTVFFLFFIFLFYLFFLFKAFITIITKNYLKRK